MLMSCYICGLENGRLEDREDEDYATSRRAQTLLFTWIEMMHRLNTKSSVY